MKKLLAFLISVVAISCICSGSTKLAFVDSKENPGSVKIVDPDEGTVGKIFTRDSGKICALAMDGLGHLYFVDDNSRSIFEARPRQRSVEAIFTHKDIIRDLQLRFIEGVRRLYFSDATGAGGDGIIYYLNETGHAAIYYSVGYTMRQTDVAGYWDGSFTFDDDGNLYLSSGNRKPASIYRITGAGPNAVSGSDSEIYTDKSGPIMGIQYVSPKYIYYADHGSKIYKLDLSNFERVEVYNGNATWLNDLSLISKPSKNTTGNYVGSAGSIVYHYPGCRWAKEISKKNEVWFQTPEEAESAGYQACKVCKPPEAS
ncbi:MAG TPA: Ada metal-binding domain-containing protein [Methanotrichaceae archaeon]|nr:Ada metal-binding domain-containing protein [Methanotrichaceae archaeon]